MRQPGFPLIIELKSKPHKHKSKKPKLNIANMQYKSRFEGQENFSPVYSNLHGKFIYVMSAKLIKNVTLTFPKSLLTTQKEDYSHETVEKDVLMEIKENVIHKKKKVRPNDENVDIYEKEYNTTSEYRRMKKRDTGSSEILGENGENKENEVNKEKDQEMKKEKEEDKKENEDEEMKDETINKKDNPEDQNKIEDKEMKEEPKDGNEIQNDQNLNMNENKTENNEGKNKILKGDDVNPENDCAMQKENSDESKKNNGENTEEIKISTPNTQENDKTIEEEEESDEEYSGEGCFIGYKNTDALKNMITTPIQRFQDWTEKMRHFKFTTPKVRAKPTSFIISHTSCSNEKNKQLETTLYRNVMRHRVILNSLKFTNSLYFPHRNLVQYDCGKLHKMAILLKTLKAKGSKVLIFTQMTKMLNLLEQFLNLYGYTYVRLDGSVKVEMRQRLVDTFNINKKIFCFISSTRCGGIGINLTGADCVVFYDTDWNPAMDKQAQDRCHRIGQEKTVHIYRLISMNTIEENIFKKSLQKRELGGMIIEGNFNPDHFKKVNYKEILEESNILKPKKIDIMREENITFHSGIEGDKENDEEREAYRRKYEEVLIKVEDQEDVDAYENAKKEIDDEFDDGETGSPTNKSSGVGNNEEEKEGKKKNLKEENQDSASKTLSGMKRHELIDWKENKNLNTVTK